MPSHYTHGPDYLDQEKKKTKKKKKTSAVDKLKEKAKGTGWGKLTRQADQERLNKLLKGM